MSLNVKPYVTGCCIVFGLFCTMAHADDLRQNSGAATQSGMPTMNRLLLADASDFGLKLDFGVASQADECDETVAAQSPIITAMTEPTATARYEQPAVSTAKPAVAVTARNEPAKPSAPLATVAASTPVSTPQPRAVSMPASTVSKDQGAATTQWEIVLSDKTLNAALARWAAAAGWQLLWELPVDYAVDAHTTIPGSFTDAVTAVTKSMETAEIPMKAIFYQGNKVLRIVAKGAE